MVLLDGSLVNRKARRRYGRGRHEGARPLRGPSRSPPLSLPADVRRKLGVESGDALEVQVVGTSVILRPAKGKAVETEPEPAIEQEPEP
jgi:AbrB family looped-hinge helix DNA binding protein